MIAQSPHGLPVTLSEAQAYLRIETGEEEALVAGLLRSATMLCEAFTGQWLIVREARERLSLNGSWRRLAARPVQAITAVATLNPANVETALAAEAYAIDIDRNGDGWVRLSRQGETPAVVTYSAGMGANANAVPEPLRQGILRLAAHMFNSRDGDGGEPPAAVTALWRPYRRMRLA